MKRYLYLLVIPFSLFNYLHAQAGSKFAISTTNRTHPPRATLETAAADYFDSYAKQLPLADPRKDLRLQKTIATPDGGLHHRYQQQLNGVPVLGGELFLHFAPDRSLRGAGGQLLTAPAFPPSPPTPPTTPRRQLEDLMEKQYGTADQWKIEPLGPFFTTSNPWSQRAQTLQLTQAYRVTDPERGFAEEIYLSASSQSIVLRYPLHCSALNRVLYSGRTSRSAKWREGNSFPGALTLAESNALTFTQQTYNLFRYTFGRDSYDNQGGTMTVRTDLVTDDRYTCPNANAFGTSVVFCSGLVADDVVAHEWFHNYTSNQSSLIYRYESGAINEALSDIFGEVVDMLNGTDDDDLRYDCNDGRTRWRIGEDTSLGTLRDLWSPECNEDPGASNSPAYVCADADEDSGGVHSNSGIVNRTFSLLVDGGSLNGYDVPSIGLTRAAHLFYTVNAAYLGRLTGFADFAEALELAARDLAGTDLRSLTLEDAGVAPLSGLSFSPAEIAAVELAVLATGLRAGNECAPVPNLDQLPPANCAVETLSGQQSLLEENWEGEFTWASSQTSSDPGNGWQITETLPAGREGRAMFAANPAACRGSLGYSSLTSPAFMVPEAAEGFVLSFNHYFSLETGFDGGQLEISRNGGEFTNVEEKDFLYNGYNGKISEEASNPRAGGSAFTGSNKFNNRGHWGQTILDLTSAGVRAGDEIQVRWTLSMDNCNGFEGWYLDEVRVGTCNLVSLPVTYTNFTARATEKSIRLNWQTESEVNNEGFTVERRAEGELSFIPVGFRPGGAAGAKYALEDRSVVPGTTYYYRLRQRDFDGSEHLSEIVSATVQGSGLRVFPNPADGDITVLRGGPEAKIELYGSDGRLVRQTVTEGGQATLLTNDLPAGIYVVKCGKEVRRISVVR